jgi:hypothetical protein
MRWCAVALVVAVAAGCRPDPGKSRYDQQEPVSADGGADAMKGLPGPDPYVPGDQRLSVGAFYEGGASQTIAVDNMTTHVYIYDSTIDLMPDPDHIEGLSADRVTNAGKNTYMGFGVNWDGPHTMVGYTKMHVSFKSADASFAKFTIGISNPGTAMATTVDATTYGYANDGQWHNLVIPLADFKGINLAMVNAPFVFLGDAGKGGDKLLLDALFFTAD